MDSFLRKQKPRLRTTPSTPPSALTEAPRAIVRPATDASLENANLPASPNSLPHEQSTFPASVALSGTPKPRKRFRKKVSGLFGDQTELKKRMSKLLIATHTNDIVFSGNITDGPPLGNAIKNKGNTLTRLIGADGIVARLEEVTADKDSAIPTKDEFDTPEFVATASRVLGSPERLQTVRKSMGRLSPRSNERFLAEMELGRTTTRVKPEGSERFPITPPQLPSVESSEFDSERELLTSPVSVDRTGAPAILRRKARRLDRGYRSVDVLRARLGGEYARSKKRFEGFELDWKEVPGESRSARRKEKSNASDCDEAETDTEEEISIQQPSSATVACSTLPVNDPLQMLVEVAAVEQKNSAPSRHRGNISCERHGQKRKIEDAERRSKRRKESR